MKINFTVEKCENPGVVFAVKAALEAKGFKVVDCGFGVGPMAGEVDLICQPPIDFMDSVPDVLTPFVDEPDESTQHPRRQLTERLEDRAWTRK